MARHLLFHFVFPEFAWNASSIWWLYILPAFSRDPVLFSTQGCRHCHWIWKLPSSFVWTEAKVCVHPLFQGEVGVLWSRGSTPEGAHQELPKAKQKFLPDRAQAPSFYRGTQQSGEESVTSSPPPPHVGATLADEMWAWVAKHAGEAAFFFPPLSDQSTFGRDKEPLPELSQA